MNLAAKNFSLYDPFIYGFPLKSRIAGNGNMELAAKKLYAEDARLIRPAGKGLIVSSINFNCRQPPGPTTRGKMEYSYAGRFCRNSKNNGEGGYIIGKTSIFKQHGTASYCCSGVEVSFLPEFIATFITSRHGILLLELEEAVAGLCALPFIPDADIILDRIGKAVFSDGIENMFIEAKSLELLSVILGWHRGHKALALPPLNEQDRLCITRALRYAEEHLSEPLVLRNLAKQASMCKSKFTSVFKIHTGLSVAEYVRHLRMEKALDFVKNTSVPLGEIAALVGYGKHSNFSRVFRDCYGVTPGAFRKKILAPTNLMKTSVICTLESV
jgi:AraC-like DNA-binding protein